MVNFFLSFRHIIFVTLYPFAISIITFVVRVACFDVIVLALQNTPSYKFLLIPTLVASGAVIITITFVDFSHWSVVFG